MVPYQWDSVLINSIKMTRKYDRYGRNRQYRRNPTRSRVFFPHQLPFQADFRLNPAPPSGIKRKADVLQLRNNNRIHHTRQNSYFTSFEKSVARNALSVGEVLIAGAVPEAIIPILGLEMLIDPKRYSQKTGKVVIAATLARAITGL